MTDTGPRIALAMNTRNEENRIEATFASTVGVDEIVVADMESTDRTVEICRASGAQVIELPNYGYCEPGRQTVIDATTCEWVLVLDGDEQLSDGGVERLRRVAADADPSISAFYLPRPTYLGPTEIQATGWSLNFERHPRFFRRDQIQWSKLIHSVPHFDGRIAELPDGTDVVIRHHCFDDLTHAWGKFNTYSGVEARELHEGGRPSTWMGGLQDAINEFLRRYTPDVDGGVSFALSFGLFFYRMGVHLKNVELAGGLKEEPVPDAETMHRAWSAFATEINRGEVARARTRVGQLMAGGDLAAASQALNEALATWGEQPDLLVEAAVFSAQTGDLAAADSFCQKVLAADPGHSEALATKLALDVAAGRRPPVTRLLIGCTVPARAGELVVGRPGDAGADLTSQLDQLPFAAGSLEGIRLADGVLAQLPPEQQAGVITHLSSLLAPGARIEFVEPAAVGA